MGSLIAALIALVLTSFALGGGAIAGITPSTITGWATVILAAWFLFLTLIVTPFRMCVARDATIAEKEKAIADLLDQAAVRVATQEQIDALWKCRADGVALRNERLKSDEEVEPWLRRAKQWRLRTLDAAEIVSRHLRHRLEVLDQMRPISAGNNPRNSEHARWLHIVSEIIARIGEYQEKHA